MLFCFITFPRVLLLAVVYIGYVGAAGGGIVFSKGIQSSIGQGAGQDALVPDEGLYCCKK